MERLYIAMIMVQFSSSQETITEATMLKPVRTGETVLVHCNLKHNRETVWYGQRRDEVPFIILSAKKKDGGRDVGVPMITGHGNILIPADENLPEKYDLSSTPSSPSTPSTPSPGSPTSLPSPERGVSGPQHCCVLLVVVCVLCAVVCSLLSLACLYRNRQIKGLPSSETQQIAPTRNEDRVEEEDTSVIYTTLQIPLGRRATQPQK
ncbi:hypothetical protein MATL_G00080010 [Megalops atlanticus]|uniref:Uncharacterized protein n=1 Tax=Megalops atlanticus TaxID=7932 RepID=A0A9D3Q7K9_MEGAT|nr:hypothetical protein MATL_G00080010 [Megalops atlanticus]